MLFRSACEYGARLVDEPDQRRGPAFRSMVGRAADGDAEPVGPDRRVRAIVMTAIGITTLLTGSVMIVLFVLASWRHRVDVAELGTMSQQWRIEQRANERHDLQR